MQNYNDLPPPYTERDVPGVHQHCSYQKATAPPLNSYQHPGYGATATHTTTIIVPEPEIIVIGACPVCRIGVLEDHFTCLELFCAIFFFPIGLLFCLLMKEKKCSNCGATFG